MVTGHCPGRVPPFGYPRIYACLRLPVAFRSLPRPSSAISALASTLRSCSLDLSPLGALLRPLRRLTAILLSVCLLSFAVQFSRCGRHPPLSRKTALKFCLSRANLQSDTVKELNSQLFPAPFLFGSSPRRAAYPLRFLFFRFRFLLPLFVSASASASFDLGLGSGLPPRLSP